MERRKALEPHSNSDIMIYLIGNCSDLEDERKEIQEEDALKKQVQNLNDKFDFLIQLPIKSNMLSHSDFTMSTS